MHAPLLHNPLAPIDTWRESTPVEEVSRVRWFARDRRWHAVGFVRIRNSIEQSPGVRVRRLFVDIGDRAVLDRPAGVQHGDVVTDLPGKSEVMGDEDHRQPELERAGARRRA